MAGALTDQRHSWSVDDAHHRTSDTRVLTASTDLNDYLDWPVLGQVFRLERTWVLAAGRSKTVCTMSPTHQPIQCDLSYTE